jgi:dienelactone hydrolase
MLYFVYPELALGYLLFAFLAALGVLQLVAARYGLAGLALIDYSGRRALGYALSTLMVLGSAVGFFASQWAKILTPGPAGSELALLSATGSASAVAAALAVAALRQPERSGTTTGSDDQAGREVSFGRTPARVYVPTGVKGPFPAIVLVPGLDALGQGSLATLARRIAGEGTVALLLTPEPDSYTYPEVLATLPATASWLGQHPEVDPQRLGALGYDLGGDLVIRAASTDPQFTAVAALAAILGEVPVGLELLREMTYLEALRWARNQKRASLQRDLNALDHAPKIAPRPFLLLCGSEDALVLSAFRTAANTPQSLPEGLTAAGDSLSCRVIQGAGHLDLLDHPETVQAVLRWFQEHL